MDYGLLNTITKTRNVSIGHGCPGYCQFRINRALSLKKSVITLILISGLYP